MKRVPIDIARASLLPPPIGPAQPRFDACWADTWPGVWYLDRTDTPSLLVLVDPVATITWSGTASPEQIQVVVDATFTERGEAMIGLHRGDTRVDAVPGTWNYCGTVVDHLGRTTTDRVTPPAGLDPTLRLVDIGNNVDDLEWERAHHADWAIEIARHGAVTPLGVALTTRDRTVTAEAIAIPCTDNVAEVAVWVAPELRRLGVGTWIASTIIERVEATGLTPYWNTNADNTASIHIAARLGFRIPVPYDLWAWT